VKVIVYYLYIIGLFICMAQNCCNGRNVFV